MLFLFVQQHECRFFSKPELGMGGRGKPVYLFIYWICTESVQKKNIPIQLSANTVLVG
jgi:hypothetical protein